MATALDRETIEELNGRAEAMIEDGIPPTAAYRRVADDAGLVWAGSRGGDPFMVGTTEAPQRELYGDIEGRRVNLWVEGDFLGFDDQIDLD